MNNSNQEMETITEEKRTNEQVDTTEVMTRKSETIEEQQKVASNSKRIEPMTTDEQNTPSPIQRCGVSDF